MEEFKYNSCVFFGGNGFIGANFASNLLEHKIVRSITLTDVITITPDKWPVSLQRRFAAGEIAYATIDVRLPIDEQPESHKLPSEVDLIVNLAAVHKEPGHEPEEYYATNIPGAENICAWATKVNCKQIIFTSSIATYGGGDSPKDETSLPQPNSPYGISKLAAEKIHQNWQKEELGRKLMIVRPGVIFGANERGNVTRMIRGIMGRYFMFPGNRSVRKAGGYVKELCRSMAFMLDWQNKNNADLTLFNFTMDPAPSAEEYAEGIIKVTGVKRRIPNMPYWLLLTTAYLINFTDRIRGQKESISPTTVKKVLKSNNIVPKVLHDLGYEYQYTLEQGLADWYKERPQDW